MALKIAKKITGYALKSNSDTKAQPALINDDPLIKRIEKAPKGKLQAERLQVELSTSEGKKKIYILVSYMEVDGVVDGEKVTIERPVEFFLIPSGEMALEDQQWLSAYMRSLSLNARTGVVLADLLQDMATVTWTKGYVRCGEKDHGNGKLIPVQHRSEVAAIAWSIQQMLYQRGFFDIDGNQVPVKVLAKKSNDKSLDVEFGNTGNTSNVVELEMKPSTPKGAECPKCGSRSLIKQSGCDQCTECSYSKCG
jgi:ribonucleoside-diphosphate reductase alpha chain